MIIILKPGETLTLENFNKAQEEYPNYIKITADLNNETVVLGGEYHADAEQMLLERGSQQKNIWGGGFDTISKTFTVNAMVNLRPSTNESADILDPTTRQKFLDLAQKTFDQYV